LPPTLIPGRGPKARPSARIALFRGVLGGLALPGTLRAHALADHANVAEMEVAPVPAERAFPGIYPEIRPALHDAPKTLSVVATTDSKHKILCISLKV
jgi:hypothetical protein